MEIGTCIKMLATELLSILENANHFLPKSFRDAPRWYISELSIIKKRSWLLSKDLISRDGFLPKFLKFGTKRFDGPRLVCYNDRFIVTSDSLWSPVEWASAKNFIVNNNKFVMHEKWCFVSVNPDTYLIKMFNRLCWLILE